MKEFAMTRIVPIVPSAAAPKAAASLEKVRGALGFVPNMMAGLAHSPAALDGYLTLSATLGSGSINRQLGEQIALTVAEQNGCDYCLAAHTAIGAKLGLTAEQITEARRATASNVQDAAVLGLARAIVETRGRIGDEQLAAARAAGLTDGQIAEVVVHVALNVLTNYFNNVAETPVDFPAVQPLPAR
jgi:uncharacterized peroxidase-related enzyme